MLAPLSGGPISPRVYAARSPAQARRAMPVAKLFRMRRVAVVIGLLVALAGLVFALQGAGILPGSYMTGDRLWLIIGLAMLVAGAGLAAWARRPAAR